MVLTAALHLLSSLRTARCDLYLYQFDRLIGSPSFALGRMVAGHRWMEFPLAIAYESLFLMVAVVLSAYVYRAPLELPGAIKAFVLNVTLAPIIYVALPVSGPAYTFNNFPFQATQPITAHVVYSRAFPNGFPSVHMSTALLICFFVWRWPLGRWLSVAYLGLTIVSTLATGEHYVLDLVAAIPYWAIVLMLTHSRLIGGERSIRRHLASGLPKST